MVFLLWLAYLMADWVTTFAIGLISHNQGNSSTCGTEVNGAIQAFWTSFLLLHLGGQDTITAFSLEDSLLWRRHLLSLIFHVNVAIYVFVQIFSNDNWLVIPTMLVLLVGVIKNVERTLALYLSSFPRLRESMGAYLSDAKLFDAKKKLLHGELHVPGDGYDDEKEAKLVESIVVKHAYQFFQIMKVFLADLIFTSEQHDASLEYFHKVFPLDALRVILVELQFMYKVLHTKVLAIRSKWSYIFCFVALNVLAVAFILFNCLNKHRLPKLDIKITYSLLFGGIALDVIALFMLVFSNWIVAEIELLNTSSSKLDSFLHKLIFATDYLRKARFATCEIDPNTNDTYEFLDTPLMFWSWSESISARNLFSELGEESPRKMYKCDRGLGIIAFSNICSFPFRMSRKIVSSFYQACETIVGGCCPRNTSLIAHTKFVSKNPFIKELWVFIFKEVKRKYEKYGATNVRKIYEA